MIRSATRNVAPSLVYKVCGVGFFLLRSRFFFSFFVCLLLVYFLFLFSTADYRPPVEPSGIYNAVVHAKFRWPRCFHKEGEGDVCTALDCEAEQTRSCDKTKNKVVDNIYCYNIISLCLRTRMTRKYWSYIKIPVEDNFCRRKIYLF